MIKRLFLILLMGFPFSAIAQNECANALDQAGKLYQAGKLNDAIQVLEPCHAVMPGKREKFEALRLLSLMYFELDNREEAAQYAKMMFRVRPYYFNYPNNDPVAFAKFLSEFKISPALQVGLSTGIAMNHPTLLQSYMATKGSNQYKNAAGIHLRGDFNYTIRSFTVSANLGIMSTSIIQEIKEESGTEKNYKEALRMLQFGIGLQWRLPSIAGQNFQLGLSGGLSHVFSANATLETRNEGISTIIQDSKNTLVEKNRNQFFIEPELSWNYMLQNRHIFRLGMGYQFYFQNLVNPDKRLANSSFVFANEYMNDDVKLGIFKCSVSYMVPLKYHITR